MSNKKHSSRPARRLRLVAAALLTLGVAACCIVPHSKGSLEEALKKELEENQLPVLESACTAGSHRGVQLEHMENTLSALKAAEADDRYTFIEFDIQYSMDNQIVVFHDLTLIRLFGSINVIGETTFDKLSEITDGEVCTYKEAMDALTKKLNIEIKSQGDLEEDQRLVDEVIADLRNRKRYSDVMMSSISTDVVDYIRSAYPDMPTGKIFWKIPSSYLPLNVLTEKFYEDLRAANADYLLMHSSNLRNMENLLALKPKNKTLVFWDFDDTMYVVHKDSTDRLWGH